METHGIAYHRLHNQQILKSRFINPENLVRHMVALQAQDFYASLWAVGVRTGSSVSESRIEQAITDGKIVRTWPMRGTLHLMAPEDAKWMLNLLTPRMIKSSAGRHRELKLDQADFNKSRNLLEKALQAGKPFTRNEIYQVLKTNGITTDGQRGYHIILYLAQKAVICCGPRRGKQHTFVLFDEWVGPCRNLAGDEALAELAARYISSRGPVSEYDFAHWAGLPITTARKAFGMVEKQFETIENNEQTFLLPAPKSGRKPDTGATVLLPAFDELICGYKDRSAILHSKQKKSVILKNGIFKPIILKNGSVAGIWKRTLKKDSVWIEADWFHTLPKRDQPHVKKAYESYGNFLGLPVQTNF